MKILLDQLINSLRKLIVSDITFLIRVHQNKFELIHFSGDLQPLEKIKNPEASKLSELENSIVEKLSELDFKSRIINSFAWQKTQYVLVSAAKEDRFFDENKIEIQNELFRSVKLAIKNSDSDKKNSLANQDYFHLFAKVSNEIIFVLDKQGVFTFFNNLGKKELGYNSEEIIGKHFFEIVSEESKVNIINSFQEIISDKNEVNFKTSLLSKMGNEKLYNVTLVPSLLDEKLDSLIGVAQNISSKNKVEKTIEELKAKLTEANRLNAIEKDRALQQINVLSELNNLKNEFISNVSHELRTPLASIIGFSETIAEDKNLTLESTAEFNEVILSESKRLAKLINDVLDFSDLESKKQELKLNSYNIIDLVKSCIKKIENDCKEKNLTLTEKIPESEIILNVDKERLTKAFNHLLANAVKFTKESGRITVIVKEFLKEVEIVISDTGVGIPEEKKPLLFNKFSKISKVGNNLPGAGFGLVSVKQIIDLHKGLINVKSEVNKGTSFIIKLPKFSFN